MAIYQLQDELSVLARDKSNATLLDDFGAEFQNEVVPAFEEVMSKLQGIEYTQHVETIGGGDRGLEEVSWETHPHLQHYSFFCRIWKPGSKMS